MLTIRSEQMHVLQTERREQFVRHAVARVRMNLPQLSERLPDWIEKVRPCIAQGLRHFSAEDDVARFVEIRLRYMGDEPAAALPESALELIHSSALPAGRRLDNFERWARTRAVPRAV